MQTNPGVEQKKALIGSRVRGISPVGKERSLEEMISEKPSLKFRMKDWTSKRRCKW